ncbi:hypothetical protein AB0M46_13530 [Dactylosporangium sp. NPDC051485]|uniref:hypothetical protein n=1 Tax=Dactylosporangium sp. NPDC051485 TaxID=3154846 RepID=UPI003426495C
MSWIDTLTEDKQQQLFALLDSRGAEHLKYADNDRKFAAWLYMADYGCRRRAGVSIFDLADFCWRDQYDDEADPREALRAALAAEGF